LKAAEGAVAPPAQPTVVPAGTTGATTYGYKVAAVTGNGDTPLSTERTISNGNANLTAPNGNTVTWVAPTALSGTITGYKVIRSTGGASQGLLTTVSAATLTYTDTGTAASAYSAAGSNPGQVVVATGPAEI